MLFPDLRSRYFIVLALRAGFWQIRMEPSSVLFTAFRCMGGLYQFTAMPYGLRNAPATLQRVMDGLLGDLRGKGVLAYLDDLLVHGTTDNGCYCGSQRGGRHDWLWFTTWWTT